MPVWPAKEVPSRDRATGLRMPCSSSVLYMESSARL